MTVVKAAGLEAYLRKPDPATGILLIYGDEAAAVRELAARAVKRIAGSLDDPFNVVLLDDSALSGDAARLADEVQSISMLGGPRAIWVRDAGDAFLKAAAPVLEGKVQGNFVVAEAGALSKGSKLRDALEKSPRAIIVPLYEANDADIAGLIDQTLARHGLTISDDARYRFMELAGLGRALVLSELEKLSLYAMGQPSISLADVEAVCGGGAEIDTSDMVDAVFTGDMDEADRLFQLLVQGGTDGGRLVSLAHQHGQRLQDFRVAMAKGGTADMVLRGARPPVFFKRLPTLQRQLAAWPLTELTQVAATLGLAVSQTRLNAAIAESLASRTLLAVARTGRALMAARN